MKTIILKQNGMGRYGDVSPFPIGDLELELQGIPTYSGEFRFLAYCNNVKCSENTVTAANNRVSIPREKLVAGRFTCVVIHYSKGIEVKRFPVEDLLVTQLETGFQAFPELAQMEQRISALERGLSDERESRIAYVRNSEERMTALVQEHAAKERKLTLALMKFAYKDYRENVYLESGSFEDFLNGFGFDNTALSDEEIKFIKGE